MKHDFTPSNVCACPCSEPLAFFSLVCLLILIQLYGLEFSVTSIFTDFVHILCRGLSYSSYRILLFVRFFCQFFCILKMRDVTAFLVVMSNLTVSVASKPWVFMWNSCSSIFELSVPRISKIQR